MIENMKIEIEVGKYDLEELKNIIKNKSNRNLYVKKEIPFINFKDTGIGILQHPIKVYLDYEDYIYLRDLKDEIYG